MSLRTLRMWLGGALLAVLVTTVAFCPSQALAQEEAVTRKIKTKVAPTYPEIARRMAITGKVKLSVVISANGTVREAKVIGGHPILVNAAMEAVKKWKYEPTPGETSGTVEFTFEHEP
ncbi:MAG TPA: energy transducer TonB [Terriglobales bacterium]|nr:energy transducer TonB [Terriglobales bacterium]